MAEYTHVEVDPHELAQRHFIAVARSVLGDICLPGKRLELSDAADALERLMEQAARTLVTAKVRGGAL